VITQNEIWELVIFSAGLLCAWAIIRGLADE
jgi:hypothetical protein